MAKVKNKKRVLSETVNKKKDLKHKKVLNPFEVHINKEKLKVLGRKLKNDRGLPGVSRAKAQNKRKHTLLPQYEVQNKSNKFTDRRIGERDRGLSAEEKITARFTAVRVKQHSKKSIFNLADDEVLTHRGQTLSEVEKFDDPRSDDDDEDSLDGRAKTGDLERSFVGDAHFGGGILKKADGAKSHKDLIDQLIYESKKRKAEMQKQKEVTLELTEKLDTEWKDLLPLVNKSKKDKNEEAEKPKAPVDEYDKVMKELRFEARGTVSDKLKTEDEIAKEEKEKLEKLEQERVARMHGITESKTNGVNHKSADDLDGNFDFDWENNDVMLSYDTEGKSNIPLEGLIEKVETDDKELFENNVEDEEDNIEDEEDNVDEEESDNEDNLSDLKESEEESEEEITEVVTNKRKIDSEIETEHGIKKPKDETEHEIKKSEDDNEIEKIKQDLLERKDIMEKARNELPFTYSLPESYETLQETLLNKPPQHHGVIIERMIKCNHPSLKEGNKDSLGMLFVYLLQYINDISTEQPIDKCFKIFSYLVPQMFDLAQLNPENSHSSMIEVIKEKQEDFRKMRTRFPGLDTLLYLKLVSFLFSTSDFRHKIVSPCIIFIEQMLTTCKVRSRRDVAYGLFLTSIIAEYTYLSKRYLPASIKFLCGLIHMSIPKTGVQLIKVLPPFKHTSTSLLLLETVDNLDDLKLSVHDLESKDFDSRFKIKALHTTLALLQTFYNNFQTLPSCPEIFDTCLGYLNRLPVDNYPDVVKTQLTNFTQSLEEYKNNRKLEYIVVEKKRPKALRLYEPNIVRVFDGKTHKIKSKAKMEQDKLLHKLKREKKGALREIRRDKSFLGRVKINKKIQSDSVRRDKVKRIYSEAAMQQSELNAIDRTNSRKKK